MFAGAEVITNRRADRDVRARLLFDVADSVGSEEAVNRVGVKRGKEFAFRVGPLVERRGSDVNRARRDQRDQLVLVERERIDALISLTPSGITMLLSFFWP